jgi:hypothetical protein
MNTFTGILLLQGILHKPENWLYFSETENTETPYFSKVISKKRFHLIPKFLQLTDNYLFDGTVHSEKLYKILHILDHLRRSLPPCTHGNRIFK